MGGAWSSEPEDEGYREYVRDERHRMAIAQAAVSYSRSHLFTMSPMAVVQLPGGSLAMQVDAQRRHEMDDPSSGRIGAPHLVLYNGITGDLTVQLYSPFDVAAVGKSSPKAKMIPSGVLQHRRVVLAQAYCAPASVPSSPGTPFIAERSPTTIVFEVLALSTCPSPYIFCFIVC